MSGYYDARVQLKSAQAALQKARLNANTLTFAAENRTSARETQRENGARTAQSVHAIESNGIGSFVLDKPIEFDVIFTSAPAVTQGAVMGASPTSRLQAEIADLNAQLEARKAAPNSAAYLYTLAQLQEVTARANRMPRGYAGVHKWLQDERKHYIGAFVHLYVDYDDASQDDIAATSMVHHLVFIGPAYKDLGSQVNNDAVLLSPRSVNFGAST